MQLFYIFIYQNYDIIIDSTIRGYFNWAYEHIQISNRDPFKAS